MGNRRVAVIGSGFGGLACAIRLRAKGLDVCVLEKRDKPGGRAYVYHDQGYTFDAGPTVVTAPGCLRELFELCGKRMEDYVTLIPVRPLYRLHWEDGDTFDYTDDLDDTLSQIQRRSPRDAAHYRSFLEYTRKVYEAGYEKLAHVPFLHFSDMVRVSPELLRLRAYRSVYGVVSRYLKDPKLRQAFSFHSLLVGGNPFSASAIYTLIHYLERKDGVYFAAGGTHALVRALVRLFEDIGGAIRYEEEVKSITTEEGKVTGVVTRDGVWEAFDAVVSNADVARTYLDLLKEEKRLSPTRRKLLDASYSMSLFLVYFGTNRRYPNLAHHNVLFGKRYRALLADIFQHRVLAEDFSLYLHAPTVTDPTLAPPGGEAFYALSPVPHLGSSIDWKAEASRYADRILSYLERHYMPGLKQSIVTKRIFTPLDFREQLNSHLGSAFSLEPLLTQSAYFRAHNRDDNVRGLYIVGAGTHPGAGIPGVVSSAKATSRLVLEDLSPQISVRLSPEVELALKECREMIRVGSKSFSLASRLFSPETRDAACFLYGWCRYVDDQIDQTINRRLQEERIRFLKHATQCAFDSSAPLPDQAVFVALRHIALRYRIPAYYALELLEGMAMDVRKERYETVDDLLLYCYRVAGTVGLMMSHVMGVSDTAALRHAASLGSAMQLTNIARDVLEDAAMGRIYLPLQWLDEAGILESQVSHPKQRPAVAHVVARILQEADKHYQLGVQGLVYLPWRAAWAVAVAARVYARIGKLVLRRKEAAWDERAVVSVWEKLGAVVEGTYLMVKSLPRRIFRPHRSQPIAVVWRHA